MPKVEPGQVFVECAPFTPSRPLRRVKVKAVFPYGSDWVPAGMAFIASLLDNGREMRLRAISLGKLHTDPRTQYGQPRRQGYLLETLYPEEVVLFGSSQLLHHARPVPHNSFTDAFEAACGLRSRFSYKHPTRVASCTDCCSAVQGEPCE